MGQCLCSWCVEARQRSGNAVSYRLLGPHDTPRFLHAMRLSARLRALREGRERAGASCP